MPLDLLRTGLETLQLDATPDLLKRLDAYIRLLEGWASRINLTGHRTREQIARRLVLDALALDRGLPELAQARDLVDLGSGAGVPGIPIACAHPALSVRLVEARERRHHFQRECIRRLNLANVEAVRGRAEQIRAVPADIVVAQAVARPEQVLELLPAWARPGALVVIPGSEGFSGPVGSDEISFFETRTYTSPYSSAPRTLWLGRRNLE